MSCDLARVDWETVPPLEFARLLRRRTKATINMGIPSCDNLTPLCLACKHNREDLVKMLLSMGARTDIDGLETQSLHYASNHKEGNKTIVQKLLQAGANINAEDEQAYTALQLACSMMNFPVALLLLQWGAKVEMVKDDSCSALILACSGDNIDIVRALLKHGADVNGRNGRALEMAIEGDSMGIATLLIEAGAHILPKVHLVQACDDSNPEMMKLLLRHGVDVNKRDCLGMTPLLVTCCENSDLQCVELLLRHGARVNVKCIGGYTPLYHAIAQKDVPKVRLLIAYKADVNAAGVSALKRMIKWRQFNSVCAKSIQIFNLLVAAGLKLSLQNLSVLKRRVSNSEDSKYRLEFLKVMDDCIAQGPLSLQDLCRITIRAHVSPAVDEKLKSLPLARHVVDDLNFCYIASENVYKNALKVESTSEDMDHIDI